MTLSRLRSRRIALGKQKQTSGVFGRRGHRRSAKRIGDLLKLCDVLSSGVQVSGGQRNFNGGRKQSGSAECPRFDGSECPLDGDVGSVCVTCSQTKQGPAWLWFTTEFVRLMEGLSGTVHVAYPKPNLANLVLGLTA
jgi:hypothetical protein